MARRPAATRADPHGPGTGSRRQALRWLDGVLTRGRAFDPVEATDLAPPDRALALTLTRTTLRRLGQIDDLLKRCLRRPPVTRATRGLLRLGAAQLLFLEMPPHAVVDTAVRLAPPSHKGLVNAVLRRLAAEGGAWRDAQDAARLNTPDWLWQSWCTAFGAGTARAIAAAHLDEPPLDFSSRGDPAAVAAALGGQVLPGGTVRCAPGGGAITSRPGFHDGTWWVQDAAAALPARLLRARRGDAVLDLCAAPGGKTAQLAVSGARVTAVDNDAARLARLRENLRRLGLTARVEQGDAAAWRAASPFILLDAPCSSTGAIRRHPDIPHIKRPDDIAAACAVQDRLLGNAAALLPPGGVLVYAVCSLQPEEGPERVAALLSRAPGLLRDPVRAEETAGAGVVTAEGAVRTLPCHWRTRGGMDGFYIARLKRKASVGT